LVAFVVSTVVGFALFGLIFYVGSRRDPAASMSWGEAMAAAAFAFFLMFWFYGVIPHQWLTWADNELGWRSDALLIGPGSTTLDNVVPLTINKQTIRDIVAVVIYVIGLGMQIYVWAWWNDRAKPKDEIVPASRYGRPLVKS
jgi:hypothetical protein